MFRSPPNLRPRGKPAVADKRKVERSLSVDSDPAPDNVMPLSKTDAGLIEACVNKQITSEDFCEAIVTRLTDRLKTVIEGAVAKAMSEVQKEINTLREDVSSLKEKVVNLESKLGLRTDELEQYQRRNNLRVFGIPEKAGEDTDELVLKVFREKLQVDITLDNIDRSHRVGRPPQQPGPRGEVRPRPIIVRFTNYRNRRRIFEAKKLLKNTGVTIREDLTACRLQVFKAAVEKHGLRNTWTLDGRIKWVSGEGRNKVIHTAVSQSDVQ